MNPINARDIKPAVISAIDEPLKVKGTSAATRRSRSAAKSTNTSAKPRDAPKP